MGTKRINRTTLAITKIQMEKFEQLKEEMQKQEDLSYLPNTIQAFDLLLKAYKEKSKT